MYTLSISDINQLNAKNLSCKRSTIDRLIGRHSIKRVRIIIEARFPQLLFIIVDFIDGGRRRRPLVAIVTGSSRSICP